MKLLSFLGPTKFSNRAAVSNVPQLDSLMKPNIKELSFKELSAFLSERKQPSFRAKQIRQWLFHKRVTKFAEMTNLSRELRDQLETSFSIGRMEILRQAESRDGTVKFLFGLAGGASIESVLIPEARRLTLCISTQAGCGFGCAFCATAVLGLARNLTAGEIVEQVLEATRSLSSERRITHVVLMGMGEPLANYAQTLCALEIITDGEWGVGISPRRVTLSTVGLVPQIQKLMAETRINLAISLHAPNEELRGTLMPVNRKYSLAQLIECCRALPIPRRKRITFEYVLLGGVNDSEQHARQLASLLRGIPGKVNVIPFNPHSGSGFTRPGPNQIERFQNVLRDAGVQVNLRRPRGDDIQAACGQLQGEEAGARRHGRRNAVEVV